MPQLASQQDIEQHYHKNQGVLMIGIDLFVLDK